MGVSHACISPGARNSPLTYAFAEKSEITCFSHVDERSSSHFALGLAKSTQKPVVLISTSGTAAANFYPAVIEASLSRVPLFILSADRPDFLIGSGANQTIDQQNLYGDYVRYFSDVGLPKMEFDCLQRILEKAFQNAGGSDYQIPPGPVHLNFPFEEPLLPEKLEEIQIPSLQSHVKSELKFNGQVPILKDAQRPLIIVGPLEGNTHQKEIIELGEKLNAPILVDPLSQLRYGFNSEFILAHYDIFLRFAHIQPDRIIRFGRKPTSKVLCQLMQRWEHNTLLVDSWQQLNDDCPHFIQFSIGDYCREQVENIAWVGSTNWLINLLSLEKTVKNEIQKDEKYHEGNIARVCLNTLGEEGCFIIGNSMPIRDVDMFTSASSKKVAIFSNRGASGIDGVVSTALGTCAGEKNLHSLLLIGDLSFYHDMNGLLAATYGINLTIVVINNSGGGIFSFLPIAHAGMKQYDQFWTTDTGLDIEKVAALYNCRYYFSKDLEELENNIRASVNLKGVIIIEVKTVISENVTDHQNFIGKVERLITEN